MKIARTKNALQNIAVGLILRLYQTVVPFLMRTAMIHFMGVQYLGLNSLFSSVLHVLNMAELGVGAAMVFSMYKPIAEDDEKTICALMRLYRKYYRLIGLFIGIIGLCLLPAIPKLIKSDIPPELDIYILYLLNLGATVLTYWLFAYKNCLLQAHQRTDLSSVVVIATSTVQYLLQLAVMIWLKNYYVYVMILLLTTIMNNVLTAIVVTRRFPQYKPVGTLPKSEVTKINQKIRDLFTAKLGSVVLNSSDTLVISAFLGLVSLAIYQNYYFIMGAVFAVVEILVSSIRAGLGNSFVVETKEKNYNDLQKFSFMFAWIIGVCSCCFLGLYQPFMEIWVGKELMLGFTEVVCFAVYFYEYSLYRLLNVYKDAAGLWHEDRFRPLITAMANLLLNLWWIQIWGIPGVILSTALSQIFIGYPWLLRNLFTLFFNRKDLRHYCRQLFSYAAAAVLVGAAVSLICHQLPFAPWPRFMVCLFICLITPNAVFFLLFRRKLLFRQSVQFVDRISKRKLQLEKHLLGE